MLYCVINSVSLYLTLKIFRYLKYIIPIQDSVLNNIYNKRKYN